MQRLRVSGAVRPIYGSLGVKRLTNSIFTSKYGGDLVTHAHFGLLRFHSESPKLHKWPPYGNFLTLRKLNCRAVTCANVHFRVQWKVGQLESR